MVFHPFPSELENRLLIVLRPQQILRKRGQEESLLCRCALQLVAFSTDATDSAQMSLEVLVVCPWT